MDCLFCSIIAGDIPSKAAYSDEWCYAFQDINPMAKVHVLVVPRVHIASCDDVNSGNSIYVSKIFEVIPKIAAELGLGEGYRVISNVGKHGCQSVKHLHFHILGGEQLPDTLA